MMKIRFGVGVGAGGTGHPGVLARLTDALEDAGIDSLWFSELVYTDAVDPMVGMAYALARTRKLKVGTSVAVLPGRHPVLVAKQLASLAALAPKRVLPVFGLRPAGDAERAAFPVPAGTRAAVFDESLRLLRVALTGADDRFDGEFFTVDGLAVAPRPDPPLDLWLGGSAPAGLDRIGRLADGWLGSFLTPAEAGAARARIEVAAAAAGRTVEADHYGINVAVSDHGLTPAITAAALARRPDTDPGELIADGWDRLHEMLDGYVEAGLTKFVVRPADASGPEDLERFVSRFARELLPRQN